jgi:hypothetical protein
MARRSRSFELESPAEPAAAVCRKALRDRGWEISVTSDGRLVGREDPKLLRCIEGPIDLEVQVLPRPDRGTEIVLVASMAGRGPIQSKRLREQIPALEREIRRQAGVAAGDPKR